MSHRLLRKGGLQTRLFFLVSCFSVSLHASENLLQAALGLDYEKQIWLASKPSRPSWDFISDPASEIQTRDSLSRFRPPRYFFAGKFDHLDLIHKSGLFAFDHAEQLASLQVGTCAIPHLDLRLSWEKSERDLAIGDTVAFVEQNGSGWDWKGSAAYLVTPWLIPYIAIGGDSHSQHENALAIWGLRGETGFGLSWSLNLGRKNRNYPLSLDLKEYSPMILPLLLRQEVHVLALAYHRGPLELTWSSQYTVLHYPALQTESYALSDSGNVWKQIIGIAYSQIRGKNIWKASADFEYAQGRHTFVGANRQNEILYHFSYEEAEQQSFAARTDLRLDQKPWEMAVYAGASELVWSALRPEVAFGQHFWDRNGVLDSHQGSLLGLFDRETWLFNGSAYLAQWGTGAWCAHRVLGWRGQIGLGYQHLTLKTDAYLTERKTMLLLAYQEKETERVFPIVRADVVTPQVGLSKDWGRTYLTASATQALLVRVVLENRESGTSTHGPAQNSEYSGGTRASLEIGIRTF